MTKFNIGDRVKKKFFSSQYSPYAYVLNIDEKGTYSIIWDGADDYTNFSEQTMHKDFILIEKSTTELEPWNLMQVSIHNKEKFKETLLNILNEGRKLTPMEVVKVEDFLGVV